MDSEEEEIMAEEKKAEDEEPDGNGGEDGGEDDECKPPEEEKEMLFLIEFLVDTLLLKPENMDIAAMDPCLLQGQTCILLSFLHFPPMSICEKDVDPCKQTGLNYIKYNAGKSLMFALSESQFENPPPIYLDVTAYKMLPHGSVPNKLYIGVTKICLVELFKQVFNKMDEKPDKLPLSKSIKDKYQLIGTKSKCPTAEVTIYIRLSCLGQNVITEFQRGADECDPFLFKSKESPKVYECKPKDADVEGAEDLCPPLPGWGQSAGRKCDEGLPPIGAGECAEGGSGGGGQQACGGGQQSYRGRGGGTVAGYANAAADDGDGEDDYEEFGTEVHGHALTIKVQKGQRKQAEDWDSTRGKSTGSMKPKLGNQISIQVPQGQAPCNKGKAPNKATVYNVDPLEGNKCGSPLQIVQGMDSPDKDVFVVRIGKKGEINGKGKLELELRTPKPKIERPIFGPRKFDKMIQTENEEQPKKGKKGKK